MIPLKTNKLIIRPWQDGDEIHYLTLGRDIGYNCFSPPGNFLVQSVEEAKEKVLQKIDLFRKKKLGKFLLFEKDKFVGTCGLEPFLIDGKEEVELGYRLLLENWGKGYATEAVRATLAYGFQDLKLARVIAFALPQNKPSIRILEKLDFQFLRPFLHFNLTHHLYEMTIEKYKGQSH